MAYTEEQSIKLEKELDRRRLKDEKGLVKANHEKKWEVLLNGNRIFTTDDRTQALSYVIKNSGMIFDQAMKSGYGLVKDGKLYQGTDGRKQASTDGIKTSPNQS